MNYKILAAVLGIVFVVGALVLPGMFTQSSTAELDDADDGLSAAISFRPKLAAQASLTSDNNYPSADALDQPGPLISLKKTLPSFSVVDKATGADVSNTEMVIKINGKIITGGGVPVDTWTISGAVKVTVNDGTYKTYSFTKSGTGNPPDVIAIPIGTAPEISIPVSNLKTEWGQFNYGEHTVKISGSAGVTVKFVDNTIKTKDVTASDLGSVVFVSSSDATIEAVQVTSNYDTTGTTTQPGSGTTDTGGSTNTGGTTSSGLTPNTLVTDNWSTGGGTTLILNYNEEVGMWITDASRRNLELRETTFTLGKFSERTGGSVYALLLSPSHTEIAHSTNDAPMSGVSSIGTNQYTFTFPAGTKTPNTDFIIALKWVTSTGGYITIPGGGDSFAGAKSVKYANGAFSDYAGDAVGKAVYYVPAS